MNKSVDMYKGKKIIQPPYLQAGDKVALVSPAYWVPQEAIEQAADVLKSWGLQPVIGPNTNKLNVNAFAGTADERAADLLWALEDDSIKAIVCSRGGYGSIHLLNRIPLECFVEHPKWIVGHGDITTLLCAVTASGLMSLHGPMAFQIASCQEPATSITHDILFGKLPQYKIPGTPNNKSGQAKGILIGGNLCSYSAVASTHFHLKPDQDIILFIEEVEESLHGIDRLFYTLMLQPFFENVKGIILGTFNSVRYDLQYGCVEQMLLSHLHSHDIPVCCGFPVGSNSCIPVIEGATCSLQVSAEESVLSYEMEGVTEPYEVSIASSGLIKEKEL